MSDLRSEIIESIAKAIWNVPRGTIHKEAAALALDAALTKLSENAERWHDEAEELGQIVWLADRDPLPADWLVAALRVPPVGG